MEGALTREKERDCACEREVMVTINHIHLIMERRSCAVLLLKIRKKGRHWRRMNARDLGREVLRVLRLSRRVGGQHET